MKTTCTPTVAAVQPLKPRLDDEPTPESTAMHWLIIAQGEIELANLANDVNEAKLKRDALLRAKAAAMNAFQDLKKATTP